MHYQTVLVTPELANQILSGNHSNRNLSEGHVNFFVSLLKSGEMKLTHQGIAISPSGRLLDGQHRLTAIARSGIPATLSIAYDVPEDVFTVVDVGNKRSAADILSIDGAMHATSMAAGIRSYILYNKIPTHLYWKGRNLTPLTPPAAIRLEYQKDPENWYWAASTAHSCSLPKIIIAGSMACLLYIAHCKKNYPKAYLEVFCHSLSDGANLEFGSPLLAYRNKALFGDYAPNPQSRLADYIKLLNMYTKGQSLKIFKSQAYPPMPEIIKYIDYICDNTYCAA